MNNTFSKTLGAVLLNKRIKQVDLAEASGVAHSIISRALKHGTALTAENYRAIIAALGKGGNRHILITALIKDRAIELGADPKKAHYTNDLQSHKMPTNLLPLFAEISELQEVNPGLISAIQKLVLLSRASAEEMDNIADEFLK